MCVCVCVCVQVWVGAGHLLVWVCGGAELVPRPGHSADGGFSGHQPDHHTSDQPLRLSGSCVIQLTVIIQPSSSKPFSKPSLILL